MSVFVTMWLDNSRRLCLVCSVLPTRLLYRPLDTRYSTLYLKIYQKIIDILYLYISRIFLMKLYLQTKNSMNFFRFK